MPIEAVLYDGTTGIPHSVLLNACGDRFEIRFIDGVTDTIDPAELKHIDSHGDNIRIGRPAIPGWRLLVPKESSASLVELIGKEERHGSIIDRIGLLPAVGAFAALAALVLVLGYAAPQWVAPHVPASWERNLGTAIAGDFGDLRCRAPKGQQSLEALAQRLSPGALDGPHPIKLAALDIPMLNAAALPGGQIVVFKPATTEIEPDQLAGLLAHEIAHVRRRHVTEALIRELGIGAFIGLFAGAVGTNAEQLLSLSYSREAEAEADADAIEMLRRANISPLPTAQLFNRLAQENGEGSAFTAEFLSSHPLSRGRAERFAAAHDRGTAYQPALTRDQADALFNICWKAPTRN